MVERRPHYADSTAPSQRNAGSVMRPAVADEFEPPFVVAEPVRQTVPFVFNAPHAGRDLSGRLPRPTRASTRWRSAGPRTRSWTSSSPPSARLGAPLMTAQLPARLSRPQPRALRARPAHVRRAPAALRQHALDAGRRRARHDPADRRRRPGDLPRAACRWRRRCRRIECLYKPYHDMLRQLVHRTHVAFGHRHADRLPFDAVDERQPASDGAKADIVLGDRFGTSCAGLLTDLVDVPRCGAAAIRSSATSPMRAASSPSITAEPALGRHALQIEINRVALHGRATR